MTWDLKCLTCGNPHSWEPLCCADPLSPGLKGMRESYGGACTERGCGKPAVGVCFPCMGVQCSDHAEQHECPHAQPDPRDAELSVLRDRLAAAERRDDRVMAVVRMLADEGHHVLAIKAHRLAFGSPLRDALRAVHGSQEALSRKPGARAGRKK